MCWHAEQVFASTLAAPRQARAFATGELGQLLAVSDRTLDDFTLILSELVSNAVEAGSGPITAAIDLHRDTLRITVGDQAAGRPIVKPPSASRFRGRGMHLIETMSSSWGVTDVASGGKQVWAELPLRDPLSAALACTL